MRAVGIDPPVAYVRVCTDPDGHSRFEDVSLGGSATGVTESDLRAVFSEPFDVGSLQFRYVVEEADDGELHNAPRRQFIVLLRGWCELEASTGDRRRFGPGTVLLADDVEGLGHRTRRIWDEKRLTLQIPLR